MITPNLPLVNDITGLNPVPVWAVITPQSIEEIADALARTDGPVSIGGGRHSMGGQTASFGSLHLDMRGLNRVISFSPLERTLRMQAGIRWRDVQRFIDPHDLSVKIMQTYANFTVGGSLSVNAHGRYMGMGPMVLSVRSIRIVLADGSVQDATPEHNSEIFYGAIGGYGGLGVIVEAELELAENTRVRRLAMKTTRREYAEHFRSKVFTTERAVFHNADMYPPNFERMRSVTWVETDKWVTQERRLQSSARSYPLHRYFVWAVTETPFGKWRRERIIDPLIYSRSAVHWRNYEASYDVNELEPASRQQSTYVLQEYFVPAARFEEFAQRMAQILQRFEVNAVNVSIRHAKGDPGTLLAWARGETFAFVLYYKQRTRTMHRNLVAIWTRELIDAAIAVGGAYYLPYQIHATPAQFHAAYPRAQEFFALKGKLDPQYRFRNSLWDTYYRPDEDEAQRPGALEPQRAAPESAGLSAERMLFRTILADPIRHDDLFRFLQNIFRVVPEDAAHAAIKEQAEHHADDEPIYRNLLREWPRMKPRLGDLKFALPALAHQKAVIAHQTAQALDAIGRAPQIDGYIEIGTAGRYVASLARRLQITGPRVVINDVAPSFSAIDIVERGRPWKNAHFVPLNDYLPIDDPSLPAARFDLITCFIGLHHAAPERLPAFVASIARLLRPGGIFLLREHHAHDAMSVAFAALAHTVFNAGLGVSWEANAAEPRHFAAIPFWCDLLAEAGLIDCGQRLVQHLDPTDNTLLAFQKVATEPIA